MAKLLKRYGYDGNVTFEQAKKTMDAIAAKKVGSDPKATPAKKYPPPPIQPKPVLAENPF
jgi:hypothetical protein